MTTVGTSEPPGNSWVPTRSWMPPLIREVTAVVRSSPTSSLTSAFAATIRPWLVVFTRSRSVDVPSSIKPPPNSHMLSTWDGLSIAASRTYPLIDSARRTSSQLLTCVMYTLPALSRGGTPPTRVTGPFAQAYRRSANEFCGLLASLEKCVWMWMSPERLSSTVYFPMPPPYATRSMLLPLTSETATLLSKSNIEPASVINATSLFCEVTWSMYRSLGPINLAVCSM